MSPFHHLLALVPPSRSWSNYDATLHAGVVVLIVLAATLAGGLHVVSSETVGNTYLAGLGYAAGRSGTSSRSRVTDPTVEVPPFPQA